jgi:molecular chaperone GrpE
MNPNVEENKEKELKEEVSEEVPQAEPIEQPEEEAMETPEEETEEVVANELETKLKEAEEKATELNDRYLRLSAEFDNYRKRTLKEKTELILNGGEKAYTSILPVLDDMERAMQTMEKATDVAAVREGVELIYTKFLQTLEQNGVKPIPTEGQSLDTDFHEAIALIDAPSEEQKGKILDCVQKGYTLNDKVIRHAKVVIGK